MEEKPKNASSHAGVAKADSGDLIDRMVPDLDERIEHIIEVRQENYRGPLPQARQLEEYERILPGAAERLFDMFEKQSHHRMDVEKLVIEGEISSKTRGQWFAFILGLVVYAGSIGLLFAGRPTEGLTGIIVATIGAVGIFVTGKYMESKQESIKDHDD